MALMSHCGPTLSSKVRLRLGFITLPHTAHVFGQKLPASSASEWKGYTVDFLLGEQCADTDGHTSQWLIVLSEYMETYLRAAAYLKPPLTFICSLFFDEA